MNTPARTAWLDRIEKIGNRLPDPVYLFIFGTVLIVLVAQLAVWLEWSVLKTLSAEHQQQLVARSVLSAEGVWWWLSHLVKNFIEFPPLAIVLVGMLGIGLAERSGFLPALMVLAGKSINDKYLIPAILFIGVMSSMALDAGYVVLPPVAAILFMSAGRSPVLGIAVSFAGVSAGFCANLFITSIDPLLAGFTEAAAQIIDPDYQVAVTSNWWFMIASTFLLTLVGWWVTLQWVAPRTERQTDFKTVGVNIDPGINQNQQQKKAIYLALAGTAIFLLIILLAVNVPGAALYGMGTRFPRWVEATVPLLFFFFLVPGLIYGYAAGTVRNSKDFARHLGSTMAELGPYIVLAFFAAQFIAIFKYTYLGEMLALTGGAWLASMQLSLYILLFGFILLACLGNLFIGSMSAKYAFMAPVFVPMLMQTGVAPELTQLAYRIGDSVTNVITPFNPYMIVVLAALQKYQPHAGIGSLISLTLPYSVAFLCAWLILLGVWIWLGIPLGPGVTY